MFLMILKLTMLFIFLCLSEMFKRKIIYWSSSKVKKTVNILHYYFIFINLFILNRIKMFVTLQIIAIILIVITNGLTLYHKRNFKKACFATILFMCHIFKMVFLLYTLSYVISELHSNKKKINYKIFKKNSKSVKLNYFLFCFTLKKVCLFAEKNNNF